MRALALALCLCVGACKSGDPNDPKTWQKELQDKDPRARIKAVQELRRLKARDAAADVSALLKDPLVKEDAALALEDIGGPDQVPALLDAVDTTVGAGSDQAARAANRTNARIAEALGNIGDARAAPVLLRLARASDDYVRLAAVDALGKVRAKEAVPELARLVDDPAAPPLLVKKAIVALGQIRDPGAIPALEHGLLLERQGVSFFPESSFALYVLGPAAVDPLIRMETDQDPAYLAWAKENNRAPAGTYAKAAVVLGDLGDSRAVPVLLQKLSYRDPDPVPGTSRLLTNLVRMFAANALGRLRATPAAAPIQALIATRDAQDEDLVAFASEALVWIGDRSQAKELMKKAQAGALKLRLSAAQAAALLGEPALGKELSSIAARDAKGAQNSCVRQLSDLALPVDDPRQACDVLAAQFRDLAPPLEAARACGREAGCWIGKLADKDALVRARAAYELGWMAAPAAVPGLLNALSDPDLTVREAAIRALDWLAQTPAAKPALSAAAPRLLAQLSAEQGKMQYVKVNEDLRRLHLKLSRL